MPPTMVSLALMPTTTTRTVTHSRYVLVVQVASLVEASMAPSTRLVATHCTRLAKLFLLSRALATRESQLEKLASPSLVKATTLA